MSDEMGNFQCVCPACSEVFELDEDAIDIDVVEYDDHEYSQTLDIQCPVCGHEQNIKNI